MRDDVADSGRKEDLMKRVTFRSHQEIFELAVAHLSSQRRTVLLPGGGGAYRSSCGGCPIGSFIAPRDYTTAMEGVPVRYIGKLVHELPAGMHAGVAALRKALRRARIDVDDARTVRLLSCLQNVHDAFGVWEWNDRLRSIAREFGIAPQEAVIQK
jgi:hypothetical protein